MKQPPILNVGPVTGKVYIVTRYRILDADKGQYEAQEKYDVTEQFDAIAASRSASPHPAVSGTERGE